MGLWDNVYGSWPLEEAGGTREDASPNGRDLSEVAGSLGSAADGIFGGACAEWTSATAGVSLVGIHDAIDTTNGMTMAIWYRAVTPPGEWRGSTGTLLYNRFFCDFHMPDGDWGNYLEIVTTARGANGALNNIDMYAYAADESGGYQGVDRNYHEMSNRWCLLVMRVENGETITYTLNTNPVDVDIDDDTPLSFPASTMGRVTLETSFYESGAVPNMGTIQANGLTIWSKILTAAEEREYYNGGQGIKYGETGDPEELILPEPIVCWNCDTKAIGDYHYDNSYYADYASIRNKLYDLTTEYVINLAIPDPIVRLVAHDSEGLIGECARGDLNSFPLYSIASPNPSVSTSKVLGSGTYIPAQDQGMTISCWLRYREDYPYSEEFPYSTDPGRVSFTFMWGDYGNKVSNTLDLYRGGPSVYPVPGGPIYSRKYVTPAWDLNSDVGDGSGDFSGYIDGEANDLQPGDWMHYVLRIGDELSSIFINGVKLAESGATPELHNYFNKTHLYNGFYFIQQFFSADIDTTFNDYVKLDQISIWAGDLTDEDILNLYNDGAGVGCSSEPPPPPPPYTTERNTLVRVKDLMEGRGGWFYDVYNPGILVHYGEEGANIHSILCGGSDGGVYLMAGTSDNEEDIPCQVTTKHLDMNDPRHNKLFGDVMLDCNTNSVAVTATPQFDNASTSAPAVTVTNAARAQVPVPVGSDWVVARNISLDIQWNTNGATPYLYIWEPRFTEVGTNVYAYSWSTSYLTHGFPGYFYHGYLYLRHVSTADLTFTITDEDGTLLTATTIAHTGGLDRKDFIRLPVCKTKLAKYSLTSSTQFKVDGEESELLVKPWGKGAEWTHMKIFKDVAIGEAQ